MRVFKNKAFNKWADDINLSDENILIAAHEVTAGNFEASLGRKVFKKRVAIGNTGKSGSTRTIIAFQEGNNIFFIFGFAKGKKSNVNDKELKALQKLARDYLVYSDRQLNDEVKTKHLFEIKEVDNNE